MVEQPLGQRSALVGLSRCNVTFEYRGACIIASFSAIAINRSREMVSYQVPGRNVLTNSSIWEAVLWSNEGKSVRVIDGLLFVPVFAQDAIYQ